MPHASSQASTTVSMFRLVAHRLDDGIARLIGCPARPPSRQAPAGSAPDLCTIATMAGSGLMQINGEDCPHGLNVPSPFEPDQMCRQRSGAVFVFTTPSEPLPGTFCGPMIMRKQYDDLGRGGRWCSRPFLQAERGFEWTRLRWARRPRRTTEARQRPRTSRATSQADVATASSRSGVRHALDRRMTITSSRSTVSRRSWPRRWTTPANGANSMSSFS